MAAPFTRSELFSGKYLLHLHTVATDGKLRLAEYFQYARDRALDRLLFLEHIRRQPSYDVVGLVNAVRRTSAETGIEAAIGFEAKVLPDGGLDISDEHLALSDLVGMAEHGFPGDMDDLEFAIAAAIEHYRGFRERGAMIWVHPGLSLRKNGRLAGERQRYLRLLHLAADNGVRLERNLHHGLLSDEDARLVQPESVVVGADAHDWKDLSAHEDFCRQCPGA